MNLHQLQRQTNFDSAGILNIKELKIMKTSIINVHDMLSVLSVEEVEKRIGEVPGVESVTVNFSAENATVRYDETRLEAADIKSSVRQKSYESDGPQPSAVKPIEDKAENTNVPPPTKTAVKPGEDKAEAPATPPVVKPPEEKDKTKTIPPASKEKADEHTGHKKDEMPKNKEEDPNEPPPTTNADKL